MKRLLLLLLAAFALPHAVNANEKVLSEMNDIEANKILLLTVSNSTKVSGWGSYDTTTSRKILLQLWD